MKKIYVIEDDEVLSELICMKLKTSGFEPIARFDGQEALDGLETEKPDLILLDVMMPRLNGFEVFDRLIAEESLKNIPVIFLTAVNNEEDIVRCLEKGAADFVTKPIGFSELIARINKVIKQV